MFITVGVFAQTITIKGETNKILDLETSKEKESQKPISFVKTHEQITISYDGIVEKVNISSFNREDDLFRWELDGKKIYLTIDFVHGVGGLNISGIVVSFLINEIKYE